MPLTLSIFRVFCCVLAASACLTAISGRTLLENYRFSTIVKESDTYYAQPMMGDERPNYAGNRLSIVSYDQNRFREPEVACGPVSLLNILSWYQNFGLIERISAEADPTKRADEIFDVIDHELFKHVGTNRTEVGGANGNDIAIILDEIVTKYSDGKLRIHTNQIKAPLSRTDLLETMPNFRSGFLFGSPKEKETGKLLNSHAMTLIRIDRSGYITLGTWGTTYHGILRMRNGKQWFIPRNPEHLEIQIDGLFRFIPFVPKANGS